MILTGGRQQILTTLLLLLTLHFSNAVADDTYPIIGQWGTGGYTDVATKGDYAFCSAAGAGMDIVDISNPANMHAVANVDTDGVAWEVEVSGDIAYVAAEDGGLYFIDISDPDSPAILYRYQTTDTIYGVLVDGTTVYVQLDRDGVQILNATNPYSPFLVSWIDDVGRINSMAVQEDSQKLFLGGSNNFYIFDISNMFSPEKIWHTWINGSVYGIAPFEDRVYFLNGKDILSVQLGSEITLSESLATTHYWGESLIRHENMLYVGYQYGMSVFEVLEPDHLIPSGYNWELRDTSYDSVRGMDYQSHYVFAAALNSGLVCYDVEYPVEANLIADQLNHSGQLSSVSLYGDTAAVTSNNWGYSSVLNVANQQRPVCSSRLDPREGAMPCSAILMDKLLYTCGSEGVQIFDITDPLMPEHLSEVETQLRSGRQLRVEGDFLYMASGSDGLYTFDISTPTAPVLLSSFPSGDYMLDVFVKDIFVYASDRMNGLQIIDISDPEAPLETGSVHPSGMVTSAVVHESIAYIACYDQGIALADVSDPNSPNILYQSSTPAMAIQVDLKWPLLAVGQETGRITFLDVTDPTVPVEIGHTDTFSDVWDLELSGTLVHAADGSSGKFLTARTPVLPNTPSILPHVATSWGWETQVLLDNLSDTNMEIDLHINNGSDQTTTEYPVTVPAGQTLSIPVSSGQCGFITGTSENLISRAFYRHTSELGIAEFELDGTSAKHLDFNLPAYLNEQLTWMGIAIHNPTPHTAQVTLHAYNAAGYHLDDCQLTLNPHSRKADVIQGLFPEEAWQQITRISADSNCNLDGIAISGNENAQLLFTKATSGDPKPDTRYLPHIATQFDYWNNYLILDNTDSQEAQATLILFANGEEIQHQALSIPAEGNLTVNLNDYAHLNADSGLLTNCSCTLNARQAYMYKETGGTAEFLLNDVSKNALVYSFPGYAADSLSWMGLAIFNTAEIDTTVSLTAFRNGIEVGTAETDLKAHCKKAFLLKTLFGGEIGTVDRIVATADTAICGLNISGAGQERYLFTPAKPLDQTSSIEQHHNNREGQR